MKLLKIAFFVLVTLDCVGQGSILKTNEKRTIICLTYDDALDSHLSTAIPQLDSLGLKGTFFLNSLKGSPEVIGMGDISILGWKKAAQRGHELGNHTLFHPCSEKFGWSKEFAIEGYTTDRLLREIEAANSFLSMLDEKRTVRAFAFPCNNTIVNGEDYSIKLDQKKIKYARIGADRTSIITAFNALNLTQVPSWFVEEGTTLPELIAFAQEARKNGKMGVYTFHGIGSSLFKISPKVHQQFLEYLAANQSDYLVTTFSDAMDFVTTNRKK